MSDVELTVSAGRREPGAFRLVATLGVAGMLSGLVLAGVHELTRPTIEANKARELREGVFNVVPGAVTVRRFVLSDGRLVAAAEDAGPTADPAVYAAYDAGSAFAGWAITGEGAGFQDTIRVLYGYDPQAQRVTGMQVLESRETPGLGDKIYKDEAFVAEFDSLAVEPQIVLVKDGTGADNEVDAITGATISSRAVVGIINEANRRWLPVLGEQPPAAPEGTEP